MCGGKDAKMKVQTNQNLNLRKYAFSCTCAFQTSMYDFISSFKVLHADIFIVFDKCQEFGRKFLMMVDTLAWLNQNESWEPEYCTYKLKTQLYRPMNT